MAGPGPLPHLGQVFRRLAQQKESRIEEGHLLADQVHMLISVPPKYAVSQVVGFIKGESAIHLARVYGEKKRNFVGQHFWARGYFVSTMKTTWYLQSHFVWLRLSYSS